ncbi:protein RETARDED ROOT GROWTH, mitochondrial isoform X2 [Ziziphus jujuba]|uniref:Protein RETARDED ROOT GROWTH, mitochondrial isoform X2 n=1 Tax=Ziziphus jujuba TaxID=326968 RepID=A0ABM3ZXZ7_ZIZJJ|nr:protein RETARDED ROOT GROWTH, mitochondrial isoform X2 [Ziziphus jujuba]
MGRWRPASFLLHHITTAAKSLALNPSFSSKPLHLSNRSRPTYHFLSLRRFSALPSRVPVDTDEFDSEDPHSCQNYGFGVQEDEDTGKIPVKAYFLCTSINLKSMQADNITYVLPPTSRSSNYIALRYCDTRSETTGRGVKKKMNRCRYMVVFQYGSAVLFNIDDHEIDSYLEVVRRYASGLLPEMRKDDYAVKEKPLLVQDMQGGPDYIVLKTLDTDSIRIIGSVLGQSIALDYFVSQSKGPSFSMNSAVLKTLLVNSNPHEWTVLCEPCTHVKQYPVIKLFLWLKEKKCSHDYAI